MRLKLRILQPTQAIHPANLGLCFRTILCLIFQAESKSLWNGSIFPFSNLGHFQSFASFASQESKKALRPTLNPSSHIKSQPSQAASLPKPLLRQSQSQSHLLKGPDFFHHSSRRQSSQLPFFKKKSAGRDSKHCHLGTRDSIQSPGRFLHCITQALPIQELVIQAPIRVK